MIGCSEKERGGSGGGGKENEVERRGEGEKEGGTFDRIELSPIESRAHK